MLLQNSFDASVRKYMHILYSLYLLYIQKVLPCSVEEALISGNSPIPDAQITASSQFDSTTVPRYARINNTDGWGGWLCSKAEYDALEQSMYIQVCLLVSTCMRVIPCKEVLVHIYI